MTEKKYASTASKTIQEDGKGMDIQYFTRLWSEGKTNGTLFENTSCDEKNELIRGYLDQISLNGFVR